MMDYRDLENRSAWMKEIIQQREHDRLVELALGARTQPRRTWAAVVPFGLINRLFDYLRRAVRPQPELRQRTGRPRFEHR